MRILILGDSEICQNLISKINIDSIHTIDDNINANEQFVSQAFIDFWDELKVQRGDSVFVATESESVFWSIVSFSRKITSHRVMQTFFTVRVFRIVNCEIYECDKMCNLNPYNIHDEK